MAEVKDSAEFRQELDVILNSKAWKFINLYRDLRSRVKRPIAQGLRKLNLKR
jgi:hypothetical protein